jgi:hypothetical protein
MAFQYSGKYVEMLEISALEFSPLAMERYTLDPLGIYDIHLCLARCD